MMYSREAVKERRNYSDLLTEIVVSDLFKNCCCCRKSTSSSSNTSLENYLASLAQLCRKRFCLLRSNNNQGIMTLV